MAIMPRNEERILKKAGKYGLITIEDRAETVVCLLDDVEILRYNGPRSSYGPGRGTYTLGPTDQVRHLAKLHHYLNRALVLMGCPGMVLNQGRRGDTSGFWYSRPYSDRFAPIEWEVPERYEFMKRELPWLHTRQITIDNETGAVLRIRYVPQDPDYWAMPADLRGRYKFV
jgi:hypothetical protein